MASIMLELGCIIVAPTDTVCGLLADATNKKAVRRIYTIKRRAIVKPLLLLVSSIDMAKKIVLLDARSEAIAKHFWQVKKVPLTLVLKAKAPVAHSSDADEQSYKLSNLTIAHNRTVAIRLPNHELLLSIIDRLEKPIVATSANITGRLPPTTYAEAKKEWDGLVEYIITGGYNPSALASTILDLSGDQPIVLREGAVTSVEIKEFYMKFAQAADSYPSQQSNCILTC
jgi:L-threonylcarbamoyladenylate synthase